MGEGWKDADICCESIKKKKNSLEKMVGYRSKKIKEKGN